MEEGGGAAGVCVGAVDVFVAAAGVCSAAVRVCGGAVGGGVALFLVALSDELELDGPDMA